MLAARKKEGASHKQPECHIWKSVKRVFLNLMEPNLEAAQNLCSPADSDTAYLCD